MVMASPERMRTLGEKEISKTLGVQEATTIKQAEMKEKKFEST